MSAPAFDLGDILKLPIEIAERVKGAVEQIVDPAQPDPEPVVVEDEGIKGDIVKALDTAIDDLGFVLKWFSLIIPDKFETPLHELIAALTKVRGWLV